MSINASWVMGRIVAPPEKKTADNGTSMLTFTVAVDKKYNPKGKEKTTYFIPCMAFSHNADFINKYFGKGDMIALVGELQTSTYTDINGNVKNSFKISVESVSFAGNKAKDNNE